MFKIIQVIYTSIFIFLIQHVNAQDYGIDWVEVKGGTFTIESDSQVILSSYCMSATEVTFNQYDTYCKATGAEKPDDNGWGRGNRPVINVSWDDAMGFCWWLSKKTGSKVRLPDEAEWEYAAVGGNKSKGYKYSGSNNWNEVLWSEGNSGHRSQPVGGKKPNELGLYDMSGNVWEWCSEWPERDSQNIKRVVRGDSNGNPASDPREPGIRIGADSRHSNIGFRIVKTK